MYEGRVGFFSYRRLSWLSCFSLRLVWSFCSVPSGWEKCCDERRNRHGTPILTDVPRGRRTRAAPSFLIHPVGHTGALMYEAAIRN